MVIEEDVQSAQDAADALAWEQRHQRGATPRLRRGLVCNSVLKCSTALGWNFPLQTRRPSKHI
jgi:hypothetical protein